METSKNLVLVSIIVFATYATHIHSLQYMDIEFMGLNCPEVISCASIGDSNFTRRNCECDSNCATYQDCCIDARVSVAARNRRNTRYFCVPFSSKLYEGAYVTRSCSSDYNGPAEMQHRCQNHNNISDPLMAVPVTDTVSGYSYGNRYCAECNNVNVNNLKDWLIQMECEFTSNMNVNNSYIWRNLEYRSNLNKWGVDVNNVFFPCELSYDIPAYLQNNARLCRPNVISSCSRTWRRIVIKRQCESYTAVMYVSTNGSFHVYRNPHCALCNGVILDAMMCTRGDNGNIDSRRKKPFSFALLMDVNQSDGDIVGVSQPSGANCGPNQKYDPYFKKCRNLVCALPGYQMVNGKCRKP